MWPPRGQARGDARGEPSEAGARRILLAPPRPWTSETDAPGTSLAARAGGFSFLYMSHGLQQQILGCVKLIQSQWKKKKKPHSHGNLLQGNGLGKALAA